MVYVTTSTTHVIAKMDRKEIITAMEVNSNLFYFCLRRMYSCKSDILTQNDILHLTMTKEIKQNIRNVFTKKFSPIPIHCLLVINLLKNRSEDRVILDNDLSVT